ncbi:LIM domain containing protein, partial [Euroglyphus maynei]
GKKNNKKRNNRNKQKTAAAKTITADPKLIAESSTKESIRQSKSTNSDNDKIKQELIDDDEQIIKLDKESTIIEPVAAIIDNDKQELNSSDNNNNNNCNDNKMNGIKSYGSNHMNGVCSIAGESIKCKICSKHVYHMEQIKAVKSIFHKSCFRCIDCNKQLNMDSYSSHEGQIYCKLHFKQLFQPKPNFNNHNITNGSNGIDIIIEQQHPSTLKLNDSCK